MRSEPTFASVVRLMLIEPDVVESSSVLLLCLFERCNIRCAARGKIGFDILRAKPDGAASVSNPIDNKLARFDKLID